MANIDTLKREKIKKLVHEITNKDYPGICFLPPIVVHGSYRPTETLIFIHFSEILSRNPHEISMPGHVFHIYDMNLVGTFVYLSENLPFFTNSTCSMD